MQNNSFNCLENCTCIAFVKIGNRTLITYNAIRNVQVFVGAIRKEWMISKDCIYREILKFYNCQHAYAENLVHCNAINCVKAFIYSWNLQRRNRYCWILVEYDNLYAFNDKCSSLVPHSITLILFKNFSVTLNTAYNQLCRNGELTQFWYRLIWVKLGRLDFLRSLDWIRQF